MDLTLDMPAEAVATTAPPARTPARPSAEPRVPCVALAGSPNAGKTSLFNALTGMRARTGNFSGTTVEYKRGRLRLGGRAVELVDLPGLYSLRAVTSEERVAQQVLAGEAPGFPQPDAVLVIADADNLERSLFLVSQLLETGRPLVVALNMVDVAERHGIRVDAARLSAELGCPVVPIVATSGEGRHTLLAVLESTLFGAAVPPPAADPVAACGACGQCAYRSRYQWTENVTSRCVRTPGVARPRRTEQIDRVLTHPVLGLAAFLAIMMTVFFLIFSAAQVPMHLIDTLFGRLGGAVAGLLPAGDLQSLIVDGVIGGVGGILVFLPQICILFFVLAVLEDTGYLARAAFVVDRIMRPVGLPGTAFVPLVSAHACAIPAIMATRVIRDWRDRLVTILVAPLMTCSARIPVYAMVAALLFPTSPGRAAVLFTGAYLLGIGAALGSALLFKHTILRGESKPLVLELPGYKVPRLRNILLYTYDRAVVFVQQAGTIILVISIMLWALATYPKSDAPPEAAALEAVAAAQVEAGDTDAAVATQREADNLVARHALEHSAAGRLGRLIEPVVRPLGFDWQIGIGVISSFAAREVIVSTLSIVYGLGADAAESSQERLLETLQRAKRTDGTAVFTTATCASLLVFYVLAMQCLPTQAVTRRETGGWRWPAFQLGYMSLLAYLASLATYQGLRFFGVS